MPQFYQPDLAVNIDNPFVRDANDKLVRRSYWLDMNDHRKCSRKWGKLTNDDLEIVKGKRTELSGRLQQRYGYCQGSSRA